MKDRLYICFVTLFCIAGLFAVLYSGLYVDQIERPAQEAHGRWKAELCDKAQAKGEHDEHAKWACTPEPARQSALGYWLLPVILCLGYGMVALSPGNRSRQ